MPCRYADDCAFANKHDAERFYNELSKRLALSNLQLAEDKTRMMRFSKNNGKDKTNFDFLGFEFRWSKGRFETTVLKRRTSPNQNGNSKVLHANALTICNGLRTP